jgi:hypothetical protein
MFERRRRANSVTMSNTRGTPLKPGPVGAKLQLQPLPWPESSVARSGGSATGGGARSGTPARSGGAQSHNAELQVPPVVQPLSLQGVPFGAARPTHAPLPSQVALVSHSFFGVQLVPVSFDASTQLPVVLSQDEVTHSEEGVHVIVVP